MSIEELTAGWNDTASPHSIESFIMRLVGELGELVQALQRANGPRWGHAGEEVGAVEEISDELGDVLFLLGPIALASGVRLETAAATAIEKVRRRLLE